MCALKTEKLSLSAYGLLEIASYENYLTKGDDSSNIRTRMKKLIHICMEDELTDRQKDCLTMRVYQNMSVEDIAAKLGIRPTTVYKHITKAKEALKKCVKYL